MAVQPRYAGACLAKVNYGSGLSNLGYTEDGAQVNPNAYWIDVPGDENGGPEGPPIEVQYLGETVDIRLLFTSWEITAADAIAARLAGGTAGTPGTPGTMAFLESKAVRLVLLTTNAPFNFPRVLFREPIEINKGTKFSRLLFVGRAYKDGSGVLYNATTS
jgi:hypothetical protein